MYHFFILLSEMSFHKLFLFIHIFLNATNKFSDVYDGVNVKCIISFDEPSLIFVPHVPTPELT